MDNRRLTIALCTISSIVCRLSSLFGKQSGDMHFIAIDLGSSFIKGAVLDLDARSFAHVRRVPFPTPIAGLPSLHFEIDPRQVVDATRALIDDLARNAPDFAGIVICSQMHSLLLMDARGAPA